jgi:phage terminase small subunit
MAGKAITAETVKKNTIAELKRLNLFKPEFNRVIGVYAETFERYSRLLRAATENDYQARTPIVISIEATRRDLLNYSAQLGLTPSAYRKISGELQPKKNNSKLAAALGKLNSG